MKRLIVNADDFGLHPAVNRAIIKGYEEGSIRSTSLIASGRAAEEAAALARSRPGLGVGVHLTLVAERPVLPPAKIPSLIGSEGMLLPDHVAFIKRYISGGISMTELRAECEAQIERTRALGVEPTHLDSHQHLHVLPGVAALVATIAVEHGFKKVRFPGEAFRFTGSCGASFGRYIAKCGLTACARFARPIFHRAGLSSPDAFFGMLTGGRLLTRNLMTILRSLPEGVSEIMIHPGDDNAALGALYAWGYHWEEELASATSEEAMQYIGERSIRLISYKEL